MVSGPVVRGGVAPTADASGNLIPFAAWAQVFPVDLSHRLKDCPLSPDSRPSSGSRVGGDPCPPLPSRTISSCRLKVKICATRLYSPQGLLIRPQPLPYRQASHQRSTHTVLQHGNGPPPASAPRVSRGRLAAPARNPSSSRSRSQTVFPVKTKECRPGAPGSGWRHSLCCSHVADD